eukprot:gene35005-42392_t
MIEDIWSKLEREKKASGVGGETSASSPFATAQKTEQTYLLFAGDSQCGKSSLIQSFLKPTSSSKENKPTIALEYNFARKTQNTPNGNAQKYICHVYEIGGDLVDSRLLDVVLTKDSLPNAR